MLGSRWIVAGASAFQLVCFQEQERKALLTRVAQ